MLAWFAPSYDNLFMGYWEQFHNWSDNPFGANMVPYARYSDGILVIWDGVDCQLEAFLAHCQKNPFGIEFTHILDNQKLVFLDLELMVDDEHRIISRTHFKPSAGNSYLRARSHHHPRWIKNVPLGQFCRL